LGGGLGAGGLLAWNGRLPGPAHRAPPSPRQTASPAGPAAAVSVGAAPSPAAAYARDAEHTVLGNAALEADNDSCCVASPASPLMSPRLAPAAQVLQSTGSPRSASRALSRARASKKVLPSWLAE
jgi:hypothetical protein